MINVTAGSSDSPVSASLNPLASLIARYQRQLVSEDPVEGAVARYQLTTLRRAERGSARRDHVDVTVPSSALRDAVERTVGPLHEKSNGTFEGPCPWHASSSGRCLVIFASGTRWWCRSCRRGGDAVAWLALIEGIGMASAARRLGLPATRYQHVHRRPTLSVEVPS